MYVSKQQIETAKNADLVEFLEINYPTVIEYNMRKKSYRHTEHDSLVIKSDFWYQFSRSHGGDQISFLVKFCNKTFPEAVKELSVFSDISCNDDETKNQKRITREDIILTDEDIINKNFSAPAQRPSADHVRNYLHGRGISFKTIDMLLEEGILYEDYRRNCVFYRENPRLCLLRGTTNKKWVKIIREIPNSYWYFKVGNNPDTIYICESPIDAISLFECRYKREGYYCAMAGLKKRTYLRIIKDLALDENGNLCKNIKLAVDWDEAGINFLENEIDKSYKFVAVRPQKTEVEKCKDWNDVLQLRLENHLIRYFE